MGKMALIMLFLVLVISVNAKTFEKDLDQYESIEVPGYNITLLAISANEKSIVTCINNEKYILSKDSSKILESLEISPSRIYEDYAILRIKYTCEECVCNESCSNNLCFTKPEKEETIEGIINESENNNENNNIEAREDIKLVSILLFLIVLILLAFLVIKRRGR